MICVFCRERIEDDSPVIETPEGGSVCQECHDERLEESTPADVCRWVRE